MNVSFNHSLNYADALADSKINKGTIYFTTDTHQIVHDEKTYGISGEDKSTIAAILQAITANNGEVSYNNLPYILQSETQYNAESATQDVFYFLYEDSWGFGDNFPVTLE